MNYFQFQKHYKLYQFSKNWKLFQWPDMKLRTGGWGPWFISSINTLPHWFKGDTCDQMLGSYWRRFYFLTWNWKRWKGDGIRSDKIWSRNFPGYYHCKIGNYSNYWKSNKWFYFLTWNLNLGVGGGLGIWGRSHEIFLYKLPKETKRNFSPFFFPQMKNGII